ncbi:MAG: glycoside hydrolase family 2, partial [Clostridia bacterium]|nr:glycoside hydrolase family 2 [Clostridia bacterium]
MENLLTRWGRELDTNLPLNDYPRPQMKRNSFINLNGEWNYTISDKAKKFAGFQGKIIVPFSPECVLSGVGKVLRPDEVLYYQKLFTFRRTGHRVLLHFGAVDYACTVTLNGAAVGEHKGGYLPFTFDVT